MYSDIKGIYTIIMDSTTDQYTKLGGYLGDLIIRFFYSRYNRSWGDIKSASFAFYSI